MQKEISRRNFVKGMMAGGVAACSASLLSACGSSSSSEEETELTEEDTSSGSEAEEEVTEETTDTETETADTTQTETDEEIVYDGLPYVCYAANPNTLELEFGTKWSESELPTTVKAYLSDETTCDLPVSGWEPIREFDANTEGIYVYGANLKSVEGLCNVISTQICKNEYHTVGSNKKMYTYNVYYRISYFETQDNYNGYERSMERLNRAVYAVKCESGAGILVSWRMQPEEYGTDVAYYVYRNGAQVNETPLSITNYVDTEGKAGDVYTVKTVLNGEYWQSDPFTATDENYIAIKLQNPGPQKDRDGNEATYSINDCGAADVDGDGEMELIVKWYPSDAFDSGKQDGPSAPTIFDVYKLDGTALWRLNMGLDIPSGAHWNQFMLYDLDEDGRAELFIKTSDGTTSYKPNSKGKFDMTDSSTIVDVIGDASLAGTHVLDTGHVSADSNEWMTVFDGETGEVIAMSDYVYATEKSSDYGDGWYNRASRYNIAIAYLPADQDDPACTTTIPAVLYNHGYYAKTTVAAYTLRTADDGSKYIQLEWGFDSAEYTDKAYGGKGNHNVATGDVDNDGFDELVLGAICLDHDGSILWVKDGVEGQDVEGHSDAISLAAMNPDDPTQLYVFTPMEEVSTATVTSTLSNAGTGTRIAGRWNNASDDIGRGLAANITPTPGYEYWTAKGTVYGFSGFYNFTEGLFETNRPSGMKVSFATYWDGDLLSELLDSDSTEGPGTIYKYDWEENRLNTLQIMTGTKLCNSTKNTPSLTLDLMGDWREEVVLRGEDDETLYIYMTNYETDYAMYSLMYDPVYRNGVANQNTSYNQPPHPGIYLGEDNADQVLAMELPVANIRFTTEKEAGTPVEE